MPIYPRQAPTQLHALPPPSGPDRSLVASEETKRKRKRRTFLPPAEKAAAVQRVLAGETAVRVADDFGVSAGNLCRIVREAKEAASRETSKKFEANDIQKVSTELAEALNLQRAATERVKVLKAKLRVLLGDE
jgi:transposase-like protein